MRGLGLGELVTTGDPIHHIEASLSGENVPYKDKETRLTASDMIPFKSLVGHLSLIPELMPWSLSWRPPSVFTLVIYNYREDSTMHRNVWQCYIM